MSAAEKLKALDVRLHEGDYDVGSELAMALPQIVAVVEAAEAEVRDVGYSPDHENCRACDLHRALAALDQALT